MLIIQKHTGISAILKYKNLRYQLITIALILIVFFNSLHNGFLYESDDNWQLLNNKQVYNLAFSNIFNYFTSFYYGQYSPINTFVYSLLYYFFGLDPFWFHFLNVSVHILNALLVYKLIRVLISSSGSGDENAEIIAFIVSLLFGLHPMQTEAVVWISSSKIILYSFFFFLSLICYVKFVKDGKRLYLKYSLLLFIISIGAKEQAIVLPLCLLVIDVYCKRAHNFLYLIREKYIFFIIAFAFGVISIYAQRSTGFKLVDSQNYYTLYQRVVLACYATITYIINLISPVYLWKSNAFPFLPSQEMPGYLIIYPILVLLLIFHTIKIWNRKDRSEGTLVFCVLFFLVNIILLLHLVPMARWSLMADRYVYIPSVAVFFLITSVSIRTIKNYFYHKTTAVIVLATYIIVCCGSSYYLSNIWGNYSKRNRITFHHSNIDSTLTKFKSSILIHKILVIGNI